MTSRSPLLAVLVLCLAAVSAAAGQQAPQLFELSLEELANVEVTSAARRQRKLSESANAVYVITREDIRRSGATTLPELLRMAPGVHVARIDGNKWAVGVRGYNDRFSNKLLVLVDGRSIYTPLFSGVFWEVEDTLLEDIDRIEVIRGPGATLWGANAVNGVINIIRRSATKTTGTFVSGGAGTGERYAETRYGRDLGQRGALRLFARTSAHDDFTLPGGIRANDDSDLTRAGARMDLFPAARDTVTITTEGFNADFGSVTMSPSGPSWPVAARQERVPMSGGFVLGNWKRALSPSSSLALQSSYEHTSRQDVHARDARDTIDLDFQHQYAGGARHEYVWGANVRRSVDDVSGSYALSLEPARRDLRLFSAFGQTDVVLQPDRVRLTAGARIEHHTLSGMEVLPNLRLLWMAGAQSAWASVSGAVRTPSRIEVGMRVVTRLLPPGALFPGSPLAEVASTGVNVTDTEHVVAYEAGYRVRPHRKLSIDVAAFHNEYDHLLSRLPGQPYLATDPVRLVVPYSLHNALGAHAHGVEVSGDWRASERLRLAGWYTERRFEMERSAYVLALMVPENNPERLASLRGYLTLPGRIEVTPSVVYAGALLPSPLTTGVGEVVTLDTATTWRVSPRLDLSIVGRDLLHDRRAQFTQTIDGGVATQVTRSVIVRSAVRF